MGARPTANAFISWRLDPHCGVIDSGAYPPTLTFQIKRIETGTALMSAMQKVNPPLLRIP